MQLLKIKTLVYIIQVILTQPKKNIISQISSNYNEEEILNKNITVNNEYYGDKEDAKFIIKQKFYLLFFIFVNLLGL